MAHNTLYFDHPVTDKKKTAPVGFSWTTFFFGFFVPLLRKDIKWAIIMLILQIITLGIAYFIFPFIYNKIYIKSLISDGYHVSAIQKGSLDHLSAKLGIVIPALSGAAILANQNSALASQADKPGILDRISDAVDTLDDAQDVADLFSSDDDDGDD